MIKKYEYGRVGFSFIVYDNRIETLEGSWAMPKKKETILLKSVTSVEVKGLTRKLTIVTNDGKSRDFNLGTQSEKAKQVIVELL